VPVVSLFFYGETDLSPLIRAHLSVLEPEPEPAPGWLESAWQSRRWLASRIVAGAPQDPT